MEPERSLPHSQVPATYPCAEPDQSSPCPPFHFLNIHLNIILPSTPWSSKWSRLFPSCFLTKTLCTPLLSLPHTFYMPRLFHSRFDHPNITWWKVQIVKLLTMQFSPLHSYLVPPRPKYSPQHPNLKHGHSVTRLSLGTSSYVVQSQF